MKLNNKQIRYLRAQAHHLKPVLMIGDKGLSETVIEELQQVLEDHELIKISIAGSDRQQRRELTDKMCELTNANIVQLIGRISVLYRAAQEPRLILPRH